MTEIVTERLRLRPVGRADSPAIHAAMQDWDVVRWLSRVPWPYALSDAEWFADEVEAGRIPAFGMHDAEGLAGVIGIDPTLGYWLRRDRWGRGYATEAGRALLARHVGEGGATVEASYFLGNAGSRHVLAKLGFEEIGPTTIASQPLRREVPVMAVRLTPERWRAVALETADAPHP